MTNQSKPWQDCEDYEIGGGDLVPAGYEPPYDGPGILRDVRGFIGFLFGAGFVCFVCYIAFCVIARIFN